MAVTAVLAEPEVLAALAVTAVSRAIGFLQKQAVVVTVAQAVAVAAVAAALAVHLSISLALMSRLFRSSHRMLSLTMIRQPVAEAAASVALAALKNLARLV